MKTVKNVITKDEKNVIVICPNCGSTEEMPVDEQRHHLKNFELLRWLESGTDTLTKCTECKSQFVLQWDYNNIDV